MGAQVQGNIILGGRFESISPFFQVPRKSILWLFKSQPGLQTAAVRKKQGPEPSPLAPLGGLGP